MSPSRSGSSHSSSWRIFSLDWFGLARDLFNSARNRKLAKNEPKFRFHFFDEIFWWKWLNHAPKNTYCLTTIHKNDLKIDYNYDTGVKLGNLTVVSVGVKTCNFFTYILLVSSARFQLKNWSDPARLSSEPS